MAASDVPPADGWAPPDAPHGANGRVRTPPQAEARPLSWTATPARIGATTWPGADGRTDVTPPSLSSSYLYAPEPTRPSYRETLRSTPVGIWSGAGVTCLWFLITGLLATTLPGYVWVTVVAALVAWLAAALLARYGDRGAAAGTAAVSGMALGIAGLVVEFQALGGEWILW